MRAKLRILRWIPLFFFPVGPWGCPPAEAAEARLLPPAAVRTATEAELAPHAPKLFPRG